MMSTSIKPSKKNKSVKISIRQVAERANVSHATVSRVLNNVDVPIADETRQLVHMVAAEMGYQPNRAARALATGRTQTIALWTTNLRSAYYGDVIHYTHEEISQSGYELMVSGIKLTDDANHDTLCLQSWPVDGIIGIDLPRGNIPGLKDSRLDGRPFVNIGAYVVVEADYVRVDFKDRAAEAVRHLASVGCRRIAYLVPDWLEWFEQSMDPRMMGYRMAMDEIGSEVEFILTRDGHRESVSSALRSHIARFGSPDGLFCYSDDMAIGAYPMFHELGMKIPDDVAIVGCDGIRDRDYVYPALTSVIQPLSTMCATAWMFLKRRIDEPSLPLQQVELAPKLEVRGSTRR